MHWTFKQSILQMNPIKYAESIDLMSSFI